MNASSENAKKNLFKKSVKKPNLGKLDLIIAPRTKQKRYISLLQATTKNNINVYNLK